MTSSTKSKVCFFKTPVILRDRTKLKKFIEGVFRNEKKKLHSLNFIFCTDEELLQINRSYLKHDYYTDIITFGLSEKLAPIEGEIYISVDRVNENAKNLKQKPRKELHRVIFHGVLHLCGLNDKNSQERKNMRDKEDMLLKSYL